MDEGTECQEQEDAMEQEVGISTSGKAACRPQKVKEAGHDGEGVGDERC